MSTNKNSMIINASQNKCLLFSTLTSAAHCSSFPPIMNLQTFFTCPKGQPKTASSDPERSHLLRGPFPSAPALSAEVQVLHVSTDLGSSLGTQGWHFQGTYDSWMSKSAPGCMPRDQSSKWVALIPQREAHLGKSLWNLPWSTWDVCRSCPECSRSMHRKTSTPAALRLSDKKRMDLSNPRNTEFMGLFPIPSTKFGTFGFGFALSTTLSGYRVLYCSWVLAVQRLWWTGAGRQWAEQ